MFAKEVGVPDAIICDASGEQSSNKLKQLCHQLGTVLKYIEEGTPWANKAELYIGLIKSAVRKDMKASNCPIVLWDYCIERRARINNLTAKNLFQLDGQTPEFSVTGEESDISNLCQFDWYEWCYYYDRNSSFPQSSELLGRVLGPAKGEGNEMAQWILNSKGKVIPRRSVRPLLASELSSDVEQKKRDIFDQVILKRLGDGMTPNPELVSKGTPSEDKETDEGDDAGYPDFYDPVDASGVPIHQQPLYDKLISAEVCLPCGDGLHMAKVIGRSVDPDGNIIGTYNDDPILNTLVYDVEFPDG